MGKKGHFFYQGEKREKKKAAWSARVWAGFEPVEIDSAKVYTSPCMLAVSQLGPLTPLFLLAPFRIPLLELLKFPLPPLYAGPPVRPLALPFPLSAYLGDWLPLLPTEDPPGELGNEYCETLSASGPICKLLGDLFSSLPKVCPAHAPPPH